MSHPIIKVEGLGKKYILTHESGERRYTALRDVISNKAKKIFSRMNRNPSKEEFWALKDINFEIQKGEAIGIIGRNGAGKSTLLKMLSRITEPTHGHIGINGRVASLLEVGTGFHPELTGKENIYLNGAILGMSRMEIKNKFEEIVDFSGIEKFLDTPVKHYSSGMYVRLAFSVAAYLEPEILVIDEILAVGDAEFQKKCLGKMDDVSKQEGRTILFVSHNMAAIQNFCSKTIYLQNGQLKNMGSTQKIIENYINDGSSDICIPWQGKHKENQFLIIHSIIIQKQGQHNEELYIDKEVKLVIDIEVLKDCSGAAFEMFVYTAENMAVFSSFTDTVTLRKGSKKIECTIPANTFNNGYYSMTIGISKNFTFFIVKLDEALKFKMHHSNNGLGWQGDYPGIVRPKVTWLVP